MEIDTSQITGSRVETEYGPVSLKLHALLDTTYVTVGFFAPWVLGYSHLRGATLYTLALSFFGLGLNLLTHYPAGVWKMIPFKWHRVVEALSPPPFIFFPWVFFSDAGAMPWFLSTVGVAILITNAFTRPIAPE